MAERDPDDPERDGSPPGEAASVGNVLADRETLRAAVEAKYDFDDFQPADMAEMSYEEWVAVFDPETWITGPDLIDRVEAELRTRVAAGELFAVVERHTDHGDPRLLAYTDDEFVLVHPDGSVKGHLSIRRDVEPVVALCAMPSYDVAEPPPDAGLPDPASISPGTGNMGHRLLLAVAAVQVLAGIILLASPLLGAFGTGSTLLRITVGFGFLVIGLVLGVLVANARLSDRFRSAAYRDRLLAAGVGTDDRPSFLPVMDDDRGDDPAPDDAESGR